MKTLILETDRTPRGSIYKLIDQHTIAVSHSKTDALRVAKALEAFEGVCVVEKKTPFDKEEYEKNKARRRKQ